MRPQQTSSDLDRHDEDDMQSSSSSSDDDESSQNDDGDSMQDRDSVEMNQSNEPIGCNGPFVKLFMEGSCMQSF